MWRQTRAAALRRRGGCLNSAPERTGLSFQKHVRRRTWATGSGGCKTDGLPFRQISVLTEVGDFGLLHYIVVTILPIWLVSVGGCLHLV